MIVIGVIGACLHGGGRLRVPRPPGGAAVDSGRRGDPTPIAILVLFALHSLIWVALVSVALIVLAVGAGRQALTPAAVGTGMPYP